MSIIFSQTTFAKGFFKREKEVTIESSVDLLQKKAWTNLKDNKRDALAVLIRELAKSKTGEKIILKAQSKAREEGLTLLDVVRPGSGSITDTTLVRKFSPLYPDKIIYETRSKVYLNVNLYPMDALLDLAHELTHYSFREPFNPYRDDFKVQDFIASTVEGVGGEVEAYLVECQVMQELFPAELSERSRCQNIYDPSMRSFSKAEGVKKFYRVGKFIKEFEQQLEKHKIETAQFPEATDLEGPFISSAYGLPYPLAAIYEYDGIMKKVCDNDEKRLSILREQQKELSRKPSDITTSQSAILRTSEDSFKARCQSLN
jgi:hypothetical protein